MTPMDIRLEDCSKPKTIPVLTSLPLQLSFISIGLFGLTAFGSQVVTQGLWQIIGIKVSFFSLFIVFLVLALLFILC